MSHQCQGHPLPGLIRWLPRWVCWTEPSADSALTSTTYLPPHIREASVWLFLSRSLSPLP